MSLHFLAEISFFRFCDIFCSGLAVQSSLDVIALKSPPMRPFCLPLIRKLGMSWPRRFSLELLAVLSFPLGKYTFANVKSPMLKERYLPDGWKISLEIGSDLCTRLHSFRHVIA